MRIAYFFLASLQVGALAAVAAPPPAPVVKSVTFGKALAGGGTVGGQEARGMIELSGPAPCVVHCGTYVNGMPSGGMYVQVSSNNAVVKVQPPTGLILVPVGKSEQTFTVLTSGVTNPTPVVISAWREGSPPQTATLDVVPPSMTRFTVDQSTLVSGASAHGTLTFNGPPSAPSAVVATLSSGNPAVQVPASVALDVNTTSVTFDVKTSGVPANTPVILAASYRERRDTVPLTLTPAVLTTFDYNGLQLNGAAPPSGAVINLSSEDPAHASVAPTVTIPAGGNNAAVSITKKADYSAHHVTISATYNGVTKKYDAFVHANVKPDMAFKDVTLLDRFGNAITHPADSQPYKMCTSIEFIGINGLNGNYLYPTSTVLHVAYLVPTGTGTSVGHEFDLPINFPNPPGFIWCANTECSIGYFKPPTCVDMPGLPQSGSYVDVTLKVDPHNMTDESNEGNNTHKLRITRQ